jgi:hypothetical protein
LGFVKSYAYYEKDIYPYRTNGLGDGHAVDRMQQRGSSSSCSWRGIQRACGAYDTAVNEQVSLRPKRIWECRLQAGQGYLLPGSFSL